MIPVVNQSQIQGRAGPAPTQPAREIEIIGPTHVRAQPEVPPVGQAGAAGRDGPPGGQDLRGAAQVGSAPAARPAAGPTGEDVEGPQDRAVFRAKVIRFLTAIYGDDEAFQRALKLGTIVIRAVEDPPEPDMRPELVHATYRHGVGQAHPADPAAAARAVRGTGGPPHAVGAGDFVAWWPK